MWAMVFVVLVSGLPATGEIPTEVGDITRVTVYRGQALVTRAISADLRGGSSELIVNKLPHGILPESIYAQTEDSVKVMSVRYREKAVMEDTRDEVKALDKEIEDVEREVKYAKSRHSYLAAQWQMFEKLKDFTVTAAQSDLNRGLLAYKPIAQLVELIEGKGEGYLNERLELEDKISELKEQLNLLRRKRENLMANRSRTLRQAVLFLHSRRAGKARIEVNYLVRGANWDQQYNLRARPGESGVLIEYNAVVRQSSGEAWEGVKLSLSTAEPSMTASPPELEPMEVILSQAGQAVQQAEQAVQQMKELQRFRREYARKGREVNAKLNWVVTSNQANIFNIEQSELAEFQRQMEEIKRTEGVSVTYALAGKLSLPSRREQQLVTIASLKSTADFTLVAMPLLTDYVYLQGEVINDSDILLLPGSASMFRNGEYVGRSEIPQVASGEKFTAGFGIDSQVQIEHELEDKESRIQGGNRIDTYKYRIALSNYKSESVELCLFDRMPYSEDSSIKIELVTVEPKLSKNSEYLRTGKDKGLLRWELELGPKTFEQNATIVKYVYTMEYDRNMQIQPKRDNQ